MPRKIRTNKRRVALKDFEAAWLEGNPKAGTPAFMLSLHHTFVKQQLWDRAGDHEAMYWEPGMQYPEPK